MSKAVAEAAVLKPEIRLAQAISEFEAHLSGTQKNEFKQERQIAPKTDDVMRLTAQIDRTMSTRGVRRVHGPLMTNFLNGVQMFVPLGDILIGGTQGMLGRGIWTVVRFSIITTFGSANQHSSYVDKLSSIFMEAGRSAPRYQNMALLFPQSKKLQAYLTEYYIVVVKLCHKIWKTSETSGITQWWDSLSNPLQGFQSQLKSWSTAIKDEVLIQSIAMAKEENEEASRLRVALQWDRKEKELKRKQKLRSQFLEQCSQHGHDTAWKQIRQTGTSKLFVNHPEYTEWRSGSQSHTLVYCGKLGAGKSVLLSNIVADLHIELKPETCCITYFFCIPENKESLLAHTILRSFARQVLEPHGDLDKIAEMSRSRTFDDHGAPDITDYLDGSFSKPIYLILDGLDECTAEQRDLVLTTIKTLQQKMRLLLCVSSRLQPDRTFKIKPQQLVSPKFLDIPENNPEIADFIDHEIKACMSSGQLKIANEEIIPTVKKVLMLGSQGMFLWVSLSIKALFNLPSDDKILKTLTKLPLKLNDTYIEILGNIPETHKTSLALILRLILVAARPLSMNELRVALNVDPGSMQWNSLTLINDMLSFLACSGGLIIVDEESLTTRFVHHSLRQLLADSSNPGLYCFPPEAAERDMAQILTTYLNYLCFDTRVSTVVRPKIDGMPIVDNVLGVTGPIGRLFRGSHKGIDHDIGKILAEAALRAKNHVQTDFSLEDYARTFWCQHSCPVLDVDPLTLKLVSQLVEKNFKFELEHSLTPDPLAWVVENGYSEAFGFLLDNSPTFDHSMLAQRLCDAAAKGDVQIIKKYLGNAAAIAFTDDEAPFPIHRNWSCKIFGSAVKSKQVEIVKLLLNQKEVCISVKNFAPNYLMNYATNGSLIKQTPKSYEDLEIVKILVGSKKIDLNKQLSIGNASSSIVKEALYRGHTDLVEILLKDSTLHVAAPSDDTDSLLSIAVTGGHTKIVELLLDIKGINWDHADNVTRNTPLHLAAYRGNTDIVSLLLKSQLFYINAQNHLRETPLMTASKCGHMDAVQTFFTHYLSEAPSIHVVDHNGRTALSWAASNGNIDIIKFLANMSDSDARSWKRDSNGRSPLSYAAEFGALDPVEFLLSCQEYTWNETDEYGYTPWHHCPEGIVRTLLFRSMDDHLRDSLESNPLTKRSTPENYLGLD